MEEPNWVTLEFLLGGLVAFHLRQAGDAVALQATVQGRAAQVRDRLLERVQAIIQGEQAVPTECHDDGLFFHGQHT
jgi:hypothetical protein